MSETAIRVPRQRVKAIAHARSVELAINDIAASLQKQLGQALLSIIVGRDARTVARWVSGEVQPYQASEQRLRDAFQIMSLLTALKRHPSLEHGSWG